MSGHHQNNFEDAYLNVFSGGKLHIITCSFVSTSQNLLNHVILTTDI